MSNEQHEKREENDKDLGALCATEADTASVLSASTEASHVGPKAACAICGQLATWLYMPGEGGKDDYYCDSCVSRGCSCNIDHETGVEDLDEHGRQLPCCEYLYRAEGFDGDEA